MKTFLLFIVVLASKTLNACGFYPYGEEVRYMFFNPNLYGLDYYSDFFYSANNFYWSEEIDFTVRKINADPNTLLWYQYCRKQVDTFDIQVAVYDLRADDIQPNWDNEMVQYLFQKKDTAAIQYLQFAKNCEHLNSINSTLWERNTDALDYKRLEMIQIARTRAKQLSNTQLKRRYAFLAIRLAYYAGEPEIIQTVFNTYFENNAEKDILYYWSIYFKSFLEKDKAYRSFLMAQVFAHAPDKRPTAHLHYNKKLPVDEILAYATTEEETANVYLLAAVQKYDPALSYMKAVYANNPTADGLAFLLMREIGKIEDYVYTPYYTLFEPSVPENRFNENHPSIARILNRSEKDRAYAQEVLHFVQSVNLKKVSNPIFWKSAQAYLQLITRNYTACIGTINQLEKSTLTDAQRNQLQMIKALALTAKQKKNAAIIPAEIQNTILANQRNVQFIFALSKELEYLNNTTDAALLLTAITPPWSERTEYIDQDERQSRNYMWWKSGKTKIRTYTDYFSEGFDYIDAVYTPEQIQSIITKLQQQSDTTDAFSVFLLKGLRQQTPQLYDLLGTKYIRQNKLDSALNAYAHIDNKYWSRNYTLWDDAPKNFDKNPFYHIKYTPQFIEMHDTIRLNKYTITAKLIEYLHKAENPAEPDRDYYYFLVANAYYNMGINGYTWMMRRMDGYTLYSTVYEDDAEFRTTRLAKHYYLQAKAHAQTEKFEALCVLMSLRSEENERTYQDIIHDREHEPGLYNKAAFYKHYNTLLTQYPAYANELLSNCESLDAYFDARR